MRGGSVGLLPAAWLAALVVGGAATRFKCELVEGQPQFYAVAASSVTSCSMLCSSSSTCEMFAFNASANNLCQLATSSPSGSNNTALFVSVDADVVVVPHVELNSLCEIVPESSPYTHVGNYSSWSGCKQACIDVNKRMLRCPTSQDVLDRLAAEFGSSVKIYLYGFRAANAPNFVDETGDVVIASGSQLWSEGEPDDRTDRDAGLYTVWSKVSAIQDELYGRATLNQCGPVRNGAPDEETGPSPAWNVIVASNQILTWLPLHLLTPMPPNLHFVMGCHWMISEVLRMI